MRTDQPHPNFSTPMPRHSSVIRVLAILALACVCFVGAQEVRRLCGARRTSTPTTCIKSRAPCSVARPMTQAKGAHQLCAPLLACGDTAGIATYGRAGRVRDLARRWRGLAVFHSSSAATKERKACLVFFFRVCVWDNTSSFSLCPCSQTLCVCICGA